ncbi:MAG: hypothetical protein OXI87_18915 [Albidovulum sp.]|nr:hypothetical protein [Albidovulum sp.]
MPERLYELNNKEKQKLEVFREKYPEWINRVRDEEIEFRVNYIASAFRYLGYCKGKKLVEQKIKNGDI